MNNEFYDWFKDSKVIDDLGNPLRLFHGTNKIFNEFKLMGKDLGIHFGTVEHANKRIDKLYDKNFSRIIPVYLKIENPLEVEDIFTGVPWSFFQKIGTNGGENILTEKEEEYILSKYEKSFEESDYTYTFNDFDFYNDIVKMIFNKGYDGIKYLNEIEVSERNVSKYEYSWVVLSPNQIKYAYELEK